MILTRLRLCDFRQYRHEHEVQFAFDNARNVTVITGVNGAGKTGLFYALNWVLYGEASTLPGRIISKAAVSEDEHPGAWVQLHFLHEGKEYVVRREMVRTPTGAERDAGVTLQELAAGGRVRQVPDPEALINVILPRDARRYFFFDGERIDELTRPGHEREVQDAVRSVLKLKVLERAAEHLAEVARGYSRALKEQGELDAEEVRLVERVEAFADQLKEREGRLTDVKERAEILKRQLEHTRAKLDQLGELKALQARERDVESRRARLEGEQRELSGALQQAVNDASAALVIDAVRHATTLLEAKRVRGEIPSGIRQQFIEDLIRDGTCICGRALDHDSRSALEARHRGAESAQLVDAVLRISGDLKGLEVKAETSRSRLQDVIQRRQGVNEQLLEVQRELEDVASKRANEFSEDVAQLEQARRSLDDRYRDTVLEQGRLEADIQRDSKQLDLARGKLSQVRARSTHGQVARRRYQLASEAAQAAQHLLSTFSADMRQQIEQATDEIFKLFVWKEKQFESVHVTDDYRLEVEDRFHTTTLAGLSAGERQVLSLAFIAGMSRVTGEEAPLVIDTPFGRLSELPVTSIVQTLPGIAKQLVLFVTDREMDPESRQLIAPQVGREYTLRFDDESGSTSLEAVA